MEVSEIFSKIANRMIQGLMFHEQMSNYYDFLGMKGYKRCHEYHYLEETCKYRQLCRYYINHYSKLIPYSEVEDPDAIPESWYRYTRQDVDVSTKKNAVRNGLEKWVEWETGTKDLYEKMYKELMDAGEVASALYLSEFIRGVDCELKKVQRYHISKLATGYDLIDIMQEQIRKHDKYKEKTEEVGKLLC